MRELCASMNEYLTILNYKTCLKLIDIEITSILYVLNLMKLYLDINFKYLQYLN